MDEDRGGEAVGRIVLVGAGKLAHAIGLTMPERVAAVLVRSPEHAAAIGPFPPGAPLLGRPDEVAGVDLDVIWLVTSDRAIPEMAGLIAPSRERWDGVTVIHSSGAGSVAALAPFASRGARTLVLHPNASFTGEAPIPSGLLWTVTSADPNALSFARHLLESVAPRIVAIEESHRALYHAAASVASNYSLSLFYMAVDLYRAAGLEDADARDVVGRFIRESVERGMAGGEPGDLLTGPISRGDIEIVQRQLLAIQRDALRYCEPFAALGGMTAAMVAGGADLERWRRVFESGGE